MPNDIVFLPSTASEIKPHHREISPGPLRFRENYLKFQSLSEFHCSRAIWWIMYVRYRYPFGLHMLLRQIVRPFLFLHLFLVDNNFFVKKNDNKFIVKQKIKIEKSVFFAKKLNFFQFPHIHGRRCRPIFPDGIENKQVEAFPNFLNK